MATKETNLKTVADAGVVAVIRAHSKDQLKGLTEALLAGGVPAIEVTMSTPKAIAGIEMLADHFGDKAVIGVGTVIDPATARDAIAAGAQFVVSPVFDEEIVATTRRYGKIMVPGAFTPTEILSAWEAGADIVKVFPAEVVGPAYFKALRGPLPQIRLMPTGGVDLKTASEFLKAGACCLGIGSQLVEPTAVANRDFNRLRELASQYAAIVKQFRHK